MTIAIPGATGQLGRLVVNKLKAKLPADRLVALARTPAKAADLGVTVREVDYDRPQALDRASGVGTLLLISANEVGKRAAQHRNAIDAAKKKAGMKGIVYTSLLRADNAPLSLTEEHCATEAMVKASAVPFTNLRRPSELVADGI